MCSYRTSKEIYTNSKKKSLKIPYKITKIKDRLASGI